jgi:hypothetical protein
VVAVSLNKKCGDGDPTRLRICPKAGGVKGYPGKPI